MKKLLITGANSYIGTSFEKYMQKKQGEYIVSTVDMLDEVWKKTDFSDYAVVFHVAGIAHIKETKKNAELYYKINKELAIETAKRAKESGVEQFVFLSSMSVYGVDTGIIDKNTPLNPKTNYGKSKYMAEIELKKLQDESFLVTILRPPMIYGEGCKGNYNMLIKFARKMPVFPSLRNRRSMLNIERLCQCVEEVIKDKKGGIYVPQDENYICTSIMVKNIAEQMGRNIRLVGILNPFVKIAMKLPGRIGTMARKAFGDLIYCE